MRLREVCGKLPVGRERGHGKLADGQPEILDEFAGRCVELVVCAGHEKRVDVGGAKRIGCERRHGTGVQRAVDEHGRLREPHLRERLREPLCERVPAHERTVEDLGRERVIKGPAKVGIDVCNEQVLIERDGLGGKLTPRGEDKASANAHLRTIGPK